MPLPKGVPPLVVGDLVVTLGDNSTLHISTIVHTNGDMESLGTLMKGGVETGSFTEVTTVAGLIVKQRDKIQRRVSDTADWRIVDAYIHDRGWTTIVGDDDNAQEVRLHQAGRIVKILADGTPEDQTPMAILLAAVNRIRENRRTK